MKDILQLAKMMQAGSSNGDGGESPLAAIADVAHMLTGIYEQLVILNRNLTHINEDNAKGPIAASIEYPVTYVPNINNGGSQTIIEEKV